MASIRKRVRKDGTPSWQVMWREPGTGKQEGITFHTEPEAKNLKRALDANGGSYEIAQAVIQPAPGRRTVADVVNEHIDMLIKPTAQTIHNYRGFLNNHIMDTIGGVPVDQLNRQQVSAWVRGLLQKRTGRDGRTMSPKTVRDIHTFLTSCIATAVNAGYRESNPCKGIDLPSMSRADDDVMFLTPAEFGLLRNHIDARYRTFITFLVMTGARFGEATALNVGDVQLDTRPASVRITRAWKADGLGHFTIGAPKSASSRRTVTIPASLVELLRPVVAGRPGNALLFEMPDEGGQIKNQRFYRSYWLPAVAAAQKADPAFTKQPKTHHLRHTHASWLVQEGVDMFKLARRLGHSDTGMLDHRYAHLMPDAQVEMATAIGRVMLGDVPPVKELGA